jgi:hypothetical protein
MDQRLLELVDMLRLVDDVGHGLFGDRGFWLLSRAMIVMWPVSTSTSLTDMESRRIATARMCWRDGDG